MKNRLKHLKRFNESFEDKESLKDRLISHYEDNRADFGDEETDNVIEILNDYDDNLSKLKDGIDKTLLLRLINNDDELYDEVDAIGVKNIDSHFNDNLFD